MGDEDRRRLSSAARIGWLVRTIPHSHFLENAVCTKFAGFTF
jgi:hypothetical protein